MAKIYCDMNIYNRFFDEQNQLRIRLETTAIILLFNEIESGVHELFWSFMLAYENRLNPCAQHSKIVKELSLLCKNNKIVASEEIRSLANTIKRRSNIKPKDALHLSCAENAGCDYFLTCDDRLVKAMKAFQMALGLCIISMNPVDFIREEMQDEHR